MDHWKIGQMTDFILQSRVIATITHSNLLFLHFCTLFVQILLIMLSLQANAV